MRRLLTASAILLAAPAYCSPGDLPMVAIGQRFGPETPRPVSPDHPLYHSIDVAEIENLPPTVKSSSLNFIAAAKRSSINAALRESFDRMNLLAARTQDARKRLVVTWNGSHTPFRIGTSNSATVSLHYRLTRVDDGRLLFDRDITTSIDGGGASASMRDNGVIRGAIATNFASAANCIDHAAYGTAPDNCALTPKFHVTVVRKRPFEKGVF